MTANYETVLVLMRAREIEAGRTAHPRTAPRHRLFEGTLRSRMKRISLWRGPSHVREPDQPVIWSGHHG